MAVIGIDDKISMIDSGDAADSADAIDAGGKLSLAEKAGMIDAVNPPPGPAAVEPQNDLATKIDELSIVNQGRRNFSQLTPEQQAVVGKIPTSFSIEPMRLKRLAEQAQTIDEIRAVTKLHLMNRYGVTADDDLDAAFSYHLGYDRGAGPAEMQKAVIEDLAPFAFDKDPVDEFRAKPPSAQMDEVLAEWDREERAKAISKAGKRMNAMGVEPAKLTPERTASDLSPDEKQKALDEYFTKLVKKSPYYTVRMVEANTTPMEQQYTRALLAIRDNSKAAEFYLSIPDESKLAVMDLAMAYRPAVNRGWFGDLLESGAGIVRSHYADALQGAERWWVDSLKQPAGVYRVIRQGFSSDAEMMAAVNAPGGVEKLTKFFEPGDLEQVPKELIANLPATLQAGADVYAQFAAENKINQLNESKVGKTGNWFYDSSIGAANLGFQMGGILAAGAITAPVGGAGAGLVASNVIAFNMFYNQLYSRLYERGASVADADALAAVSSLAMALADVAVAKSLPKIAMITPAEGEALRAKLAAYRAETIPGYVLHYAKTILGEKVKGAARSQLIMELPNILMPVAESYAYGFLDANKNTEIGRIWGDYMQQEIDLWKSLPFFFGPMLAIGGMKGAIAAAGDARVKELAGPVDPKANLARQIMQSFTPGSTAAMEGTRKVSEAAKANITKELNANLEKNAIPPSLFWKWREAKTPEAKAKVLADAGYDYQPPGVIRGKGPIPVSPEMLQTESPPVPIEQKLQDASDLHDIRSAEFAQKQQEIDRSRRQEKRQPADVGSSLDDVAERKTQATERKASIRTMLETAAEKAGANLTVHETPADLIEARPEVAKRADGRQINAFYLDPQGGVHVVLESLKDLSSAGEVIAHELEHYGLDLMDTVQPGFRDGILAYFGQVTGREKMLDTLAAAGNDPSFYDKLDDAALADEYLAAIAGKVAKVGKNGLTVEEAAAWDKVVAWCRDSLGVTMADEWHDRQVANFVRGLMKKTLSGEAAKEAGKAKAQANAEPVKDTTGSKRRRAVNYSDPLKAWVIEQGGMAHYKRGADRIVDGKQVPGKIPEYDENRKLIGLMRKGGLPLDELTRLAIAENLVAPGTLPDEFRQRLVDTSSRKRMTEDEYWKIVSEKEAADTQPTEAVKAESLAVGDQFTIKGESYEVLEETDAALRIKDGVEYWIPYEDGATEFRIDKDSLIKGSEGEEPQFSVSSPDDFKLESPTPEDLETTKGRVAAQNKRQAERQRLIDEQNKRLAGTDPTATPALFFDQNSPTALFDYRDNGKGGRFSVAPGKRTPVKEPISREVLSRMSKILKREGYDIRGADDVREILDGRLLASGNRMSPVLKDGFMIFDHFDAAYREATDGVQKRLENKSGPADHPNVNRKNLKKLGYTGDIREAGYITPDGKFVDLSGKREGGTPGMRSLDHREAGGSKGMQEFMAEGNIRIDAHSGMADMYKEPTPQQYRKLEELAARAKGLVIELDRGLGEEGEDYYYPTRDRWNGEYNSDSVRKAFGDIRRFFAGETMPESGARFSVFPAQDSAYLAAVEKGDTETAQRMVDEAAKAAGYNVGPVWHGTPGNGEFTTFRTPAWFSDSRDIAENYSRKYGSSGAIKSVYLKDPQAAPHGSEPSVIVFNVNDPSQIKSSDPVTRDAQGRVIPPSERFNPESRDIRFSVSTAQVRTPKFKDWFGDWEANTAASSKLVDRQGRPMIVYHGTGADFTVFDMAKAGQNFDAGEKGAFFTNNTSFRYYEMNDRAGKPVGQIQNDMMSAGAYAEHAARRNGAPNIMPVYLNLRNPLIIEENTDGGGVLSLIERQTGIDPDVMRRVKDGGHDGIIARDLGYILSNGEPETVAVAFKPEQIKSATGNTGSFDTGNPDIRFSVRPIDNGKSPDDTTGMTTPEAAHGSHNPQADKAMSEEQRRRAQSIMSSAVDDFYDRKIVRAVGYRLGSAPDSGKSYNTRDGKHEEGISLIGINDLPQVQSFAISGAKEQGRDTHYYKGDVLFQTGGDDEFIMINHTEISKQEFDLFISGEEGKKAAYVLATRMADRVNQLSGRGYTISEDRLKSWNDAYSKAEQEYQSSLIQSFNPAPGTTGPDNTRFSLRQRQDPTREASVFAAEKIMRDGSVDREEISRYFPTADMATAMLRGNDMANEAKARLIRPEDAAPVIRALEIDKYHDAELHKAYEKIYGHGWNDAETQQKLEDYRNRIREANVKPITPDELARHDAQMTELMKRLDVTQEIPPVIHRNPPNEGEEQAPDMTVVVPKTIADYLASVKSAVMAKGSFKSEMDSDFIVTYRKTLETILKKAVRQVSYGKARETLVQNIDRMKENKTAGNIDELSGRVLYYAYQRRVKDIRAENRAEIRKTLARDTVAGRVTNQDRANKGKINPAVRERFNYARKIERMSHDETVAEQERLDKSLELLESTAKDVPDSYDSARIDEIGKIQWQQHLLDTFGDLAHRAVEDSEQAVEYLKTTLADEMLAHSEKIAAQKKMFDGLRQAVQNSLPPRGKQNKATTILGKIGTTAKNLSIDVLTLKDRLQLLPIYQGDAGARALGERVIADLWQETYRNRWQMHSEIHREKEKLDSRVAEIYAGRKTEDVYDSLYAVDPVFRKFSRNDIDLSRGNILQILASIRQGDYGERQLEWAKKAEILPPDISPDALQSVRENLERGGMNPKNYAEGSMERNLIERVPLAARYLLEADMVRALGEQSAQDAALIDALSEFYRNNREPLSRVNQEITGLKIPVPDPLYMPIRREGQARLAEVHKVVPVIPPVLTRRVFSTRDIAEDANILDMFANRLETSKRYEYFAELGLRYRYIFENNETRNRIIATHGRQFYDMLIKHITDVLAGAAPGVGESTNARLLESLNRTYTVAKLTFNWGQYFRQPVSSIPMFGYDLGYAGVVKNIVTFANGKINRDPEMMADWDWLWNSDLMKERRSAGASQVMNEVRQYQGSSVFYQKLRKAMGAGMHPIAYGDTALSCMPVIAPLFSESKRLAMANGAESVEAARQEALYNVWTLIETTQSSGDVLNLTAYQRSGNAFEKMASTFLGPVTLQYSREFTDIQKTQAEYERRVPDFGRARAMIDALGSDAGKDAVRDIIINHIIGPLAYNGARILINALKGDDPDEQDAAMIVASMLAGPVSGIAIWGAAIVGLMEWMGQSVFGSKKARLPEWDAVPLFSSMRDMGYLKTGFSSLINGDWYKAVDYLTKPIPGINMNVRITGNLTGIQPEKK